MVNVPGRSRGCSACRQRKIKCDESIPECLRCVKAGLLCPGPRTGAFFLHALPHKPSTKSMANHVPIASTSKDTPSQNYRVGLDGLLPPPLPSVYQPSRASIFDQLFVSHFIESFGFKAPASESPSPTWLDRLADFLSSPVPCVAKHSIRAGSMIFYGVLVHDVSIQIDARNWYLRALHSLQHLLSQNRTLFTDDLICASVMLAHFESLANTSEEAWLQHVLGAAMMLKIGGSKSCRNGFLHDIFRHLRLLTWTASLLRNEQHDFARPDWMTVPFEVHGKTIFDYLVDILFSVLQCLVVADKMIKSAAEESNSLGPELDALVFRSISQLNLWWLRCAAMSDSGEMNEQLLIEASSDRSDDVPGGPDHFPILCPTNMPAAALTALYDAANVLVFRLLFLVSPSAYLYEERIRRHVQSILSAKELIASTPGPASDRGFLMVELPLKIVEVWSPSLDQGDTTVRLYQRESAQDRDSVSFASEPKGLFTDVATYIRHHHFNPARF